jgi:putative transcriptional regulator
MKDELFKDLVKSVKEGGAILRGEKNPSRKFVVTSPDIKNIRKKYQMTQSDFAVMIGISVKTLRNWEQGRRMPVGPARILLLVAAKHPEAVLDVILPSDIKPNGKTKQAA